ncbi:hypothetical protein AGABI1DRAFT_118839 [Agaricus bisporus var. burnettii JB137-S8]|uniref:Ion transport domain-containing protein n=1 Tax=Agaricus bisporus var. burnettii (strain JB137-S8 / ATCC MYA-4627 / FGSC 10392) TaxID=597362 RepID=K5X1S2_AGABU|nr:uncharacterized protein AGABI1DRAFT_118839 [Agaricus bisporus var. burnettii JB137-S8]EKM81761.1 hypothetical protein AGABI1DRAFT_118839 [Agaricus bisporus var. burnettii JB137-S8]
MSREDIDKTSVFPVIHMIRSLVAPDITYSLIRPLVEKYSTIQREGNLSVVFCLLLNRVYFLKDENLSTSNISRTRGMVCEILAIRVLRQVGADMYPLAVALVTSWPAYNGVDPAIIAQVEQERDDDLEYYVGNAIELAILGKARKFIKTSACQKIIKAIWTGRCVYQAQSSHSILSDTYKQNPIHFYDPHKAPLLDHYRLRIPAIRSVLEYTNFLILFILFIVAIEYHELDSLNVPEIIFMVYALGFSLEKIATMQEHGMKVYFGGTWNGFDLAFVTIYFIYAVLRFYGVYHHNHWARELGIDLLAITATLMFPRLAFVTLKNNLMVLSLRAMFMQFLVLMLIAMFCFCGFVYGFWTTIAWWMSYLYFGLDATGFLIVPFVGKFHPLFGPVLWITYACLSNTLLTTGMDNFGLILSNTFARINEDAEAEPFPRSKGHVKADFFFSYQPPINVLVLCFMLPARYVLTPRWFHKVNVFMIRVTNLPILLLIAIYERQAKKAGTSSFYDTARYMSEKFIDALPRYLTRLSIFEGLAGSGADIETIFEINDEFIDVFDSHDSDEGPDTRLRFLRSLSMDLSPNKMSGQNGHRAPSPPSSLYRSVPRIRTDSVSTRTRPMVPSQSYVSPLAQIYPSVVENILGAQPTQTDARDIPMNGSSAKATGIPTVPPTRRRLTTMQSLAQKHRISGVSTDYSGSGDVAIPRKKSSTSSAGERQRSMPLCTSPEQLLNVEDHEEPASVSEVRTTEDQDEPVDTPTWDTRLQEIERRQARIESLLEHIATRI